MLLIICAGAVLKIYAEWTVPRENKGVAASAEYKAKKGFAVSRNHIYLDGKKFLVKGISYSFTYPGEVPWEIRYLNPFPKDIYNRILNDIKNIKSLNANTLRIWSEDPYPIYEAAKAKGLYIFITIWTNESSDYHSQSSKDFHKNYIKSTVDQVHNRNGIDYSDSILAYAIANELSEANIKSTDSKHPEITRYDGEYISAPEESTPTECFIAEMADYLKKYEHDTYGVTHLVTYSNMQPTDLYKRDTPLIKCDFLDFITFNAYCFDTRIFSENPLGSHTSTYYQGWIEKTKARFPEKPLLISEFGLSVAPGRRKVGPPDYGYGGNTEQDQADGLASNWEDITTAKYPVAGGMIFYYQDIWWTSSWGISEPIETDKNTHDPNDVHEWDGIVGIEGTSPQDYTVKKRKAYYRVKEMFKE